MTGYDRFHAAVEANIAFLLGTWWRQRSQRYGQIVSGQVGFRLKCGRSGLSGGSRATRRRQTDGTGRR